MKKVILPLLLVSLVIVFGCKDQPKTWSRVEIEDFGSILIPSTMELEQKSTGRENARRSIIRPKSKGTKKKNSLAIMVTVITEKSEKGDYPFLSSNRDFLDKYLENMEKEMLNTIYQGRGYENNKDFIKHQSMQIEEVNGAMGFSLRYIDFNLWLVECTYTFLNNDRMHTINYFFPVSEINSWGEDLELIVLSPEITEIK